MTLHERGVENRIICIVRKAVKGLLGRTANQGRPSPTQTGQENQKNVILRIIPREGKGRLSQNIL